MNKDEDIMAFAARMVGDGDSTLSRSLRVLIIDSIREWEKEKEDKYYKTAWANFEHFGEDQP